MDIATEGLRSAEAAAMGVLGWRLVGCAGGTGRAGAVWDVAGGTGAAVGVAAAVCVWVDGDKTGAEVVKAAGTAAGCAAWHAANKTALKKSKLLFVLRMLL